MQAVQAMREYVFEERNRSSKRPADRTFRKCLALLVWGLRVRGGQDGFSRGRKILNAKKLHRPAQNLGKNGP